MRIYFALFALIGFMIILLSFTKQPTWESYTNSAGIEMVEIEAGTFTMGDQNNHGDWDEQPHHSVTISYPFAISQTEITADQFRQFRSEYQGSEKYAPYATRLSWYDAQTFCNWLSKKEGKIYRLPTEAEWEFVCRAGTKSLYSTGDSPPEHETPNPWGVYNMHTGVLEWCNDWYGSYSQNNQTDPIGPEKGFVRVIRGGLPDNMEKEYDHSFTSYARSANRAGIAPGFTGFILQGPDSDTESAKKKDKKISPGLIGVLFNDSEMTRPNEEWLINNTDSDQINWQDNNDWSARWLGFIKAPYTGEINFSVEADNGLKLIINNQIVIDGWGHGKPRSGKISLIKGKDYPIVLSYFKKGGESYMRLYWQWEGSSMEPLPPEALWHNKKDQNSVNQILRKYAPGKTLDYSIGFRVVQAPLPKTMPLLEKIPFARKGIKQNITTLNQGPDPGKPYFRKRILLPIPLENCDRKTIDYAGFHPSFRGHNHSPALEVCSNGDVLLVIYSSYHEYEPGVSLIASRLRYGADRWDMPSPFIDFPDINDHAPLLWNDQGTLHLFWGNPRMNSAFPFQWMSSKNNGADFWEVKFPQFRGDVGPHSRQPINSAFRDDKGIIYVSSDGVGGRSVLWISSDNGKNWIDMGSRSGGRHTTYVLLKNGNILGMGGKNTSIDGFMPQSVSSDGGKSWFVSKTIFPALASNQRPTIIRLKSGRLFFACDFQKRGGAQPVGIKEKGALVALSDDEGETWHIKKLPGTLSHEKDEPWGNTIGYSVARQAPNGIIHLITTMNHPSLHFSMNESWILSDSEENISDEILMASSATEIRNVRTYRDKYRDGKTHIEYNGGIADDGRFLLHGKEIWYYPNGQKQWEATYSLGRKVSEETYWYANGDIEWQWLYQEDGKARWTQFWQNGRKKAESHWLNMRCEGQAKCWDYNGNIFSDVKFADGKIVE